MSHNLSIAAAKSRSGEAAGAAASIAHQIFAAIGFTREHRLNLFTRALWSWRDEFGSEAQWNRVLGEAAQAGNGRALWSMIVSMR
jgi:alkylation response protein AidB-like acyl-CoA dehydrogenase